MPTSDEVRFPAPAVPSHYVARPRLTRLLDTTSAPLTLLAAGPGSGKTALLSDWVLGGPRPVAWIPLTAADDSARRFWPLFLQAARSAGLPVHDVAQLWRNPATLLADPALVPVIVLDDAHLLTDPGVLDGLDLVVRCSTGMLRLVLAARSDPLIPLNAYRADARVCEIRAADLAMTSEEARRLLAAHRVTLPERDLSVLMERTGGWAAGVRLCAMRMEGTPEPRLFVGELALDQGSIGEFLIAEVLERQPAEVRTLLLETSFLPEVTGPLADALCRTDHARDLLDALARRNSFVVALDPARSRFRYHPLLREVLVHLLDREAPERRRELYRRAATWEHRHGDVLTGLAHAVGSGDRALVATLLVRGGLAEAFARARPLPLTRLPDEESPGHDVPAGPEVPAAELALAAAHGPLDDRDLPTALDRARSAGGTDTEVYLALDLAALVLARRTADLAAVESVAAELLSARPDRLVGPGLRAAVLLVRARARFLAAGPRAAAEVLADAAALAEVEVSVRLRLEVLAAMATLQAYESGRRHSDDPLAQAHELLASQPDLERPACLDLAIGGWAFVHADYETAAAAARRAVAAAEADSDAAMAAGATVLLARVLIAADHCWGAQALLHGVADAAGRAGGLLAAAFAGERARLETALGRPHAALAAVTMWRSSPWAVQVAGPAARACLALGDLDQASTWLARVLDLPASGVPRFLRVDALLCAGTLARRRGDEEAACRALLSAVEAADDVVVQPFHAAGAALADLANRHPGVAARLPVSVGSPLPRQQEPDGAGNGALAGSRFDHLTERERAVLRLLSTDLATAEIAGRLFLSTNTVKTYLSSIYRKLGARSRVDAVARARSLELL